jgi:hypothetical protein
MVDQKQLNRAKKDILQATLEGKETYYLVQKFRELHAQYREEQVRGNQHFCLILGQIFKIPYTKPYKSMNKTREEIFSED